MEEEFSILSSYLKMIASIEDCQKLYINNDYVNVYDITLKNSLWRFISGNSRETTIKFINDVVYRSMFFTLMNINNVNRTIILNDLIESMKGIDSLIYTYSDDKIMVSKLRVIREKIDNFVNTAKSS